MAQVDDPATSGENPATDQLSIDSGLAEWVYHRAVNDQGLSLGDIAPNLVPVALKKTQLDQYGLISSSADDFIYNIADGFTAAVVEDPSSGTYTIVYRGTDVADAGPLSLLVAALTGGGAGSVDGLDVQQDVLLGGGTLAPVNQGADAIALAQMVLELAGGDTSKVHLVGQSLG